MCRNTASVAKFDLHKSNLMAFINLMNLQVKEYLATLCHQLIKDKKDFRKLKFSLLKLKN